MSQWIVSYGFVDRGSLSGLIEEGVLVSFFDEKLECVISSFYQSTIHRRPLREDDGFSSHRIGKVESVTPEDIAREDILSTFSAFLFDIFSIVSCISLVVYILEPHSTCERIVLQYIDSVDTRERDDTISFPLVLTLCISHIHDIELATEYLCEEVAISAGRLEKSGVYTIGLISDEIEHSVYLTIRRKNLTMIGDTFSRFGEVSGHFLLFPLVYPDSRFLQPKIPSEIIRKGFFV